LGGWVLVVVVSSNWEADQNGRSREDVATKSQ